MKLNAAKTKTIIVSRSHKMNRKSSPAWTIDELVLKEREDLNILLVTFDAKMTFEELVRSDFKFT